MKQKHSQKSYETWIKHHQLNDVPPEFKEKLRVSFILQYAPINSIWIKDLQIHSTDLNDLT